MNTPHVYDVTDADFPSTVIARSFQVPVVVDFWAPWCGPCRVLGPVLEREIEALGGRVLLAKLNTDENPDMAARYGISSIPAVKAFRDGEVAREFVGALPAQAVRAFLAELAPSAAKQSLDAALALVREGHLVRAEAALRDLLGDPEVGGQAAFALAAVVVELGRTEELEALLDRVPIAIADEDTFEALRRRAALIADARAYGGEDKARAALDRNPNDLEARWALAASLAARGEYAGALEHFLEIVTRSRKFRDDGARKSMLAIFQQLGPDDDLTREYRRRLQVVT